MKKTSALTSMCLLLLAGGTAQAQTAPVEPTSAPPAEATPAVLPAPAAPQPAAPAPALDAPPPPEDSAAAQHAEHEARKEGTAASAAEALPEKAAPTPTISGFVETSYHANWSDLNVAHKVPMRVYDPAGHSFTLHSAHLAIAHTFAPGLSAVVSLDAGRDAVANSVIGPYPWTITPQFGVDVQEAYATYTSGIFSLTAGKFVTYEGIEVVQGPLNPTITRGFLYGFAEPVTHTGVKFHFAPSDQVNIGVGVVNGWDLIGDNNGMKTFLGRIGLTPSKQFFAALSGSFGSEQAGNNDNHRLSLDLTGCLTEGDFLLWFQGNYGSEPKAAMDPSGKLVRANWYGLGVQPVYTSGDFSLGGRVEYFADPQGARTGSYDSNYVNVTVTPGYQLAHGFKLRGELRMDHANAGVLSKAKKNQFTSAVSAEYVF